MGILRLLLATSVVIAHSSSIFGFHLVGGSTAVQAFFIISGFYITLILNEKYIGNNSSYKLFITNRLLRLYPIYLTVFLMTLLASLVFFLISSGNDSGSLQPYIDNISNINIYSLFFLILSNITMFFQDIVMFLGLDTTFGELFFTTNFRESNPRVYTFLVIPQAWSISIEITFYLIAPFLVKRKIKFIYILVLITGLLRIILYKNGLNYDPWTYRFFPTELLYFLLGTIGYHLYKKIESLNIHVSYLKKIYGFIFLFTLIYSFIPFKYKSLVYLFVFFLSIPFIFILSKNWKLDRYIGELSYPVYISHLFIMSLIHYFEISIIDGIGLVTTVLTIIFSLFLNEFIAKKIEVFRQKRIKPVVNKSDRSIPLNTSTASSETVMGKVEEKD